MARVLADDFHKRVVIVDTSNEIGGDGDVPHPAIGGARRMQVPDPSQQHKVMVSTKPHLRIRRFCYLARIISSSLVVSQRHIRALGEIQPHATKQGDCPYT